MGEKHGGKFKVILRLGPGKKGFTIIN